MGTLRGFLDVSCVVMSDIVFGTSCSCDSVYAGDASGQTH